MLTSHEKGCEHVGDLPVSDSASVLVLFTAKGSHHVVFILGASQEERGTD